MRSVIISVSRGDPLSRQLRYGIALVAAIGVALIAYWRLSPIFGRVPFADKIDAMAGWHVSSFAVKPGDRVRIRANGRIHLATNHIYNQAQFVKMLVRGHRRPLAPGPEVFFYREWIGPEGEEDHTDELDECRIKPDHRWGALLFAVAKVQTPNPDRRDPLRFVKENGLNDGDIRPVVPSLSPDPILIEREGLLSFIVNEAVLSPESPSPACRGFYEAVKSQGDQMRKDDYHRIPVRSIPLICFANNTGFFDIQVEKTN